jgi:hypothetical protein
MGNERGSSIVIIFNVNCYKHLVLDCLDNALHIVFIENFGRVREMMSDS